MLDRQKGTESSLLLSGTPDTSSTSLNSPEETEHSTKSPEIMRGEGSSLFTINMAPPVQAQTLYPKSIALSCFISTNPLPGRKHLAAPAFVLVWEA